MNYSIISPPSTNIESLLSECPLTPFAPDVIEFISALSDTIFKDNTLKTLPELVALAFWLRPANILKLRSDFETKWRNHFLIGRGLAFHIAPANVDTIFIYSWFLSMLAGNTNIIRLSTHTAPQVQLLINAINSIKDDRTARRFMLVHYGHNEDITAYFSGLCNVRIIWGGDNTISTIRKIPLRPTAVELAFADRFSLCIINAHAFIEMEDKTHTIEKFYNDAYWFNQMACSSPRLVVWIGNSDDADLARTIFWQMLKDIIIKKSPDFIASKAVDKLATMQSLAIKYDNIKIEKTDLNLLNRVLLKTPESIDRTLHCGGGLFYELILSDLDALQCVLTAKEQTVSVIGFTRDEILCFLNKTKPRGIDRIVSVGKSLQFSSVWDGFDLLREFSKEVDIEL
ncbi:MAG: hypothetical protein L3V56_01925 [Candidatus Magnetoovum sp. WYHC-5]|nr:hypothetical protein [Candidatus Magnetoovum sp. WYHC-5]